MIQLSNAFDKLVRKKEVRILILGFKNAGKTTIMKRFEFGDIISTKDGNLEIENLHFMDVQFTSWNVDCGFKPECKNHYSDTKGIVFVVDRGDREKMIDAKKELHAILSEPELKSLPLLIVANKHDLHNAMTLEEIIDSLCLKNLENREWNIMDCCANNGYDLCSDVEGAKGLHWFFEKIS